MRNNLRLARVGRGMPDEAFEGEKKQKINGV